MKMMCRTLDDVLYIELVAELSVNITHSTSAPGRRCEVTIHCFMTSQRGIRHLNVLELVCAGGLTVNYLFEPAVIVIYNVLSHVWISNNPQSAMSTNTAVTI